MNTTATKRTMMIEKIERHGIALLAAFPNASKTDPFELCRALRRIENKAHRFAELACNVGVSDAEWDAMSEKHLASVRRLLGLTEAEADALGLFVNGDPRGYALKLDRPPVDFHRDMGGYGILAPDFSN